MSDKPVQWRTPDGVMRNFRLRKLRDQTRRRASLSTLSLNTTQDADRDKNKTTIYGPTKSQNPFAKKRPASEALEVVKKRILSSTEYEDPVGNISAQSDLLCDSNSSEGPGKDPSLPPKPKMPFVYLEEDSIQGIFTDKASVAPTSGRDDHGEPPLPGVNEIPIDWTIKRKARFLSNSTFGWCARIKGAEEANAMARSTRCQQSDIPPKPNFGNPSEEVQKSWRIELARHLTYWQQPIIPWLSLFPRFGQSVKLHSGTTPAVPQSDDVIKSFYDAWVISFRSVYQLTREQLCPYFYVCTQQYSALFRARGICGESEINCVLTPATTGFRQSLNNEGITFSRAKGKNQNMKKTTTNIENKENSSSKMDKQQHGDDKEQQDGGDDDDEEDGFRTDDETTWDLISKNIKVSGPKDISRQSVHAATSARNTLIIRGTANTQLLFSYLINSKNSIAKSGAQANVPPTILSPVAFQGAGLQKLTVRSGIARSYSESSALNTSQRQQFSLDISGPLLPHNIIGITGLLRKTQGFLGYKAAFSAAMYSAPFNTNFSENSGEDDKVLSESGGLGQNFGVSDDFLKSLGVSPAICLNQVTLSNGLYLLNS